jgi:hydroxymethylglutaryl-CoA reductase
VKIHPTARALLAILQVSTAHELASIIAAVGLAQNFGAMRALATEGIQKGHMSLHAQNIAFAAGAIGEEVAHVSRLIIERKSISEEGANLALAELRGGR